MKQYIIIFLFVFKGAIMFSQVVSITQQQLDSLPYIVVDKDPQFPGGNSKMMTFIAKNLQYPPIQRCEPEGSILVKFIVETNGKISNVTLDNNSGNLGEYYTKEAIRVISSMPDWTPGKKNGKPVRTSKWVPVKFHLR